MASFLRGARSRASQLFSGASNYASGLWNEAKKRGSTLLTGTHYVGPFNALDDEYKRTHPPKDRVDLGGLIHDTEYSELAKQRDSGAISHDEARRLIRESDNRFLENTATHFKENPWAASLGYAGIYGKTKLEDWGLIDPNKFVTAKLGLRVPQREHVTDDMSIRGYSSGGWAMGGSRWKFDDPTMLPS